MNFLRVIQKQIIKSLIIPIIQFLPKSVIIIEIKHGDNQMNNEGDPDLHDMIEHDPIYQLQNAVTDDDQGSEDEPVFQDFFFDSVLLDNFVEDVNEEGDVHDMGDEAVEFVDEAGEQKEDDDVDRVDDQVHVNEEF